MTEKEKDLFFERLEKELMDGWSFNLANKRVGVRYYFSVSMKQLELINDPRMKNLKEKYLEKITQEKQQKKQWYQ